MNITGLEVIRVNRGSLEVAPPGTLELTYGDTLRITTSFDYRGPAVDITLYGSIGIRHPFPEYIPSTFDEKISAEVKYKLPNSPTAFVPVTASVDIHITADINPGTGYDIYCKIREYPEAGLPEVDDVITITGIPPTFKLLEETIYPYAYVYDGPHDGGTITFRSDPFSPVNWIKGKLAANAEDQVKKSGGRMLEMRVYVDQSPLLWNDWRIEVITAPPKTTAGLGMSLGIVWWAVAILLVLAIVLIIVLTYAIKEIAGTFTHQALSEEIKKTWSRESLISVIGDFETKLERTPTPTADLEKKSDQELRDYCNSLAKEIVPPVVPGLGIAVAVLGVAAVGLLVAFGLAARGK